jgi:fructokinase
VAGGRLTLSRMPYAILAGVEMGGTKCVCTLGTGPDDIRAQQTLPTRDPRTTLEEVAALLEDWRRDFGSFSAIGVAAFGPIDLRRGSPTYGRIQATPKELWRNYDLAGFFARRFDVPLGLSTDVIAAALAEGRWGSARGLSDYAYVTVGTGIGVGLIVAGKPAIGLHHPEMGHARIARLPGDDWPGNCPFHGACVEGLASGPAIRARTGHVAEALSVDSPVWESVAHAISQLAHLLAVSVAPQRILIGGGVASAHAELFPRIRALLAESLNGYLDVSEITSPEGLDRYLVPPGLGSGAGPLGSLAIAADSILSPRHDDA